MKIQAKTTVHDHLVDDSDHKQLTPGYVYNVIEIDDEYFRVIDDAGEPILYRKGLFEILDASIPAEWKKWTFDDGEYRIGPPELSRKGFYEAYFDRKPEAIALFEAMRRRFASW